MNGKRRKQFGRTYRVGARSVVVLIAGERTDAGHLNWSSSVTTFLQLTYSGLLLAVFAQQIGLPIPSVVFLMAAGALSAHGAMSPTIIVLFECFGLPGGRWAMVLARPQVGF